MPAGSKILIVDDDAMLRRLLSMTLKAARFNPREASGGEEAIRRVQEEVPDLIILDLLMPVMDGLHFLNWLRHEAKLSLPVLLLTASSEEMDLEEAMQHGPTILRCKPIDRGVLLNEVRRLLELT